MKKNKLLLLLVLLLTAATGAWAQEGTLLTTILSDDNTDFKSGSKTFDNKATVTFSGNVDNYVGWGWYSMEGEATLTVTAAEGYTITRVKFYTNSGSAFDEEAPFEAILVLDLGNYKVFTKVNDTSIGESGVTQIDVYGYAAPAGYTVSMKSGTKDAEKWTVKVGEGQAQALPIGGLKGDGSETVTLQYNGRLKVKGVKATSDAAPAVKPAATVTTAPTGAAVVGVGKTTALVSGGVADGGTLMYAVTTTNTKPTSTAGFSDAVPTAQSITASGKVYVWYYVKGDDTHTDSEIAATAIEVPVADIVWDVTNVSDLNVSEGAPYEKDGVTMSSNSGNISAEWDDCGDPEEDGIVFVAYQSGGFTFTAPAGKAFTKIEMKPVTSGGWNSSNLGTGWAFINWTVTWKGSAASTVKLLTDADDFRLPAVTSIVFYLSE